MIVTLVVVALACLAGLAVLRPFALGRSGALHADADPDEDLRRALLRQLRDLDDDLAAGKLTSAEHRELRAPVQTEAVAVLRRIDRRVGSGELAAGLREIRPPERGPRGQTVSRRRRLALGLAAAVVLAGGVTVLLTEAISPRGADSTITGGAPAAQGAQGRADDPIAAAQARIKQNPKDIAAHLDLAQLYLAAGRSAEAAIEFLAATRIQPGNAAANTGLALVAFGAGHASEAKKRIDQVLAARPDYPEALYARGLIELMGLGQPGPAERDLKAYLAAAPFGSHKSAVRTLLASITAAGK